MNRDLSQSQQLKRLVQVLTTSGKSTLNEEKLKMLKKICKSSDYFVIELFSVVFKQLRRHHAEVRLSAFQILDEIFVRSHCFRELVLKNFKKITELTILIESKPNTRVLKPEVTAKKLRTCAIEAIRLWHEKFKDAYLLLKLGYEYLRDCKHVDFESAAVITGQDRLRREENERKTEEIKRRRIGKIESEMAEKTPEISSLILEFKNTFKLLIPDLDNFFIPIENERDSDAGTSEHLHYEEHCDSNDDEPTFEFGSSEMREHGLTKETTVQVNLSNIHQVHETPDNEVIVSTLREQISNVKKSMLPVVKEWEQSIMQYSSSYPELLRKIIDLKRSLESILLRYSTLTIIPQGKGKKKMENANPKVLSSELSDSDDDDDFIDVPLDDPRVLQASSEAALLEEAINSSIREKVAKEIPMSDLEAAGSSGEQNSKPIKRKPSERDVDKILSATHDELPTVFHHSVSGLTNIWAANEVLHDHEEDVIKPSGVLGIATRPVNYEREWEPVRWECRAPLATGRLCPRKDRERCPLHGLVIPRDELGRPVGSENIRKEQERLDEYERANPAWQNPVLLAEIRASTGVDLSVKRAKKRKRRFPNLTNIRAVENTPRRRLEKKVCSKKSLRRINKQLSKLPN